MSGTAQATIPWNSWIRHRCPSCGLTGEGRTRLIQAAERCARCEERQGIRVVLQPVDEPFILQGSDAA